MPFLTDQDIEQFDAQQSFESGGVAISLTDQDIEQFDIAQKVEKPKETLLTIPSDKLQAMKIDYIEGKMKHVSGPPEFQNQIRQQLENEWNIGLHPLTNVLETSLRAAVPIAGGEATALSVATKSVVPAAKFVGALAGFSLADKVFHLKRLFPDNLKPHIQDVVNLVDFGIKGGLVGVGLGLPEYFKQRGEIKGFDFNKAAQTIEEHGKDKQSEVVQAAKDTMQELVNSKIAEKVKPSSPQTLFAWTLKSGRVKTSALSEYLGKEWKQQLPFSLAKNAGRDPSELYSEAVGEGLIPPMPTDYTGGEGQYFIDHLKESKGKFLENTKQFESQFDKEFEAFKERNTNEKIIEGTEISGIEKDIAQEVNKLSDEEVLNEFVGLNKTFKTPEEAQIFISTVEKQGGKAEIIRVGPDEVEISSTLDIGKLPTEALETYIDERYAANAPQSELDRLETIYDKRVVEHQLDLTEEEVNIGEGDIAGSDLTEALVKTYHQYITPKDRTGGLGDADFEKKGFWVSVAEEMSRQPLKKGITDKQVKEAAKDLYEHKVKLLERQKGKTFDVQPTMPPKPLQPQAPQAETSLTALRHGLSPEVQQTIFDNANDAFDRLIEQEQVGRVLLPKTKAAETEIQDPKLRAALYAGRRKTSYIGSGLINWIQESSKAIWEGIKLEYEPTLKDWPQLQDDIRTGPITFGRRAREQSDLALGGLIGNLNNFKEDQFWNIIGMRDLVARGGEGITLPRNLRVEDIQIELNRVLDKASKDTKEAVAKYDRLMDSLGKDLIDREKISPDELKTNYFPHYVLDYLPSWWDDSSAFLPKRLRQPYGQYLKKAVGSTKDIAISKEALIWHLSSIFMDNAIDDWAGEQLIKYDKIGITDEQSATLGQIRPNQVVNIGNKAFRGFQYKPGRQIYPVQMTNPSVLNKAVEEGMSVGEWMSSTGPKGGAAITQGVTLGRYNKVYLLPVEIYDRMSKLKAPYASNPFLQIALPATSLWKRVTLDFAGIPFQVNNFFGDFENLYRTAPGAAGEIGTALKIVKELRHPDTLSEWQKHVLQTATDKDVLGAGFVQEYAHISPGMTPRGLLERLERFSGLREGVLRLAMLSFQMKRTEVGLPVVAPEFKANVSGLDKLSAAGYVARNFTVDYLAIPDWYKQYVRGFAAPFITFWHLNAKNWAKYTVNDPTGYTLKFLAPRVGLWAYNNTGERKQVEERLPDYWRFRPPHIILNTEDINNDGKPEKALIWTTQLPSDMAASFIGMDKIGDKFTQIRSGKMTPKEAALQQMADFGFGAPKTLHSLLNPMIQFFEGVASNRDPQTHQDVVPSELERADAIVKTPYYVRYLISKIATPFGQYLQNQKGTQQKNLLMSGPLDLTRALGIHLVNLTGADAKVEMDQARKLRGDYDTFMYKIEQRYLAGRDYSDIEKEAQAQGIELHARNIDNRLQSTRVQIEKLKTQMRQTTDPTIRRRMELEFNDLTQKKVEEYKKTLPKGVRP